MAAPPRFRLHMPNMLVSAFYSEITETDKPIKFTCAACAPVRTTMKCLLSLQALQWEGDDKLLVYECQRCRKQWAYHIHRSDVENP